MRNPGLMRLLPLATAVALLALTISLWPSGTGGGGGLVAWANIVLLMGLAVVMMLYGLRLLRERQEPRAGSRLRAKLVIALVGMLLVPSMIIQIAASQMVERGMDVWFDMRVDTLLDRALDLAQGFYARVETDMKQSMIAYMSDAVLVAAAAGSTHDYSTLNTRLSEIRDKEDWQQLQLFDVNERLIAGVQAGGLSALKAEPLTEAARLSATLGRVVAELVTRDGSEVAVGYAPLSGPQGVVGLLRVEVQLAEGVMRSARVVESDYRTYRELERNRQGIRDTFTHVMLIVTLLVVLVAGMVGVVFARRLTSPIGELARALHRITEGDLDVSIPEVPQDELGSLVRSFNRMALRLKQNVEALEKTQEELTDALTSSRQRQYVLETLLANLHSGVLLADANGQIRLLNQSLKELLQLPASWAPGREVMSVCTGRLRDLGKFYNELCHQAEEHLQREFEIAMDHQNIHILAHGARLSAVGSASFSGYLMVLDDISSLAEAQRNRAWAEVAQRLAHEIKNPLTPIKLAAERLQRRFRHQIEDETVFDTCTQAIIGQVERLQRLIADFSTLARMPQPKLREISVQLLLQEMRELYSAYPRVQVDMPDDGITCWCDPDQLRQVLINLMDNALAATEEKGADVHLYGQATGEHIEFHMLDRGPGISASAAEHIFEAYFSTKDAGSGLGLAIAKRIAEEHDGELSLLSPVKPTHFCLRLPIHPAMGES
ncbi:MAG: ATP-binding protein [Mariprofundaceae bacterium]